MADKVFRIAKSGQWALGHDHLQWILMRLHQRTGRPSTWDGIAFVSSDKKILARCMREKDVSPNDAAELLAGLPATFAEWHLATAQPINAESTG